MANGPPMLACQDSLQCRHCGQDAHKSYIPGWIKKRVLFEPDVVYTYSTSQEFQACFDHGRLVLQRVASLVLLNPQSDDNNSGYTNLGTHIQHRSEGIVESISTADSNANPAATGEEPPDLRDPQTLNDPHVDLARFKGVCRASLDHLHSQPHFGQSSNVEANKESSVRSLKSLYAREMAMLDPTMVCGVDVWLDLHQSGRHHQALLLGTTLLDRLLGNILFTVEGPDTTIPFIMRELLAVPCLATLLGSDTLRILWTLMGSPLTLNLRNLSWHGFLLPCDDVPQDAYNAMLITVFMSILHKLQEQSIALQLRCSSPYYERHSEEEAMKDEYSTRYGHLWTPSDILSTALKNTHLGNCIRDSCQRSKLVTNGSLDQWRDACEHIAHLRWQVDQRPLSDTGDCHDHSHHDTSLLFVMATLPLLEHGLRRMYVDLNRCKPDREHALVGGDYYVTLDVILDALVPEQFFNDQHPAAETVDGKNGTRGQPNRLLSVLGPERVNICYDLFVSPHGPRLRDRVSHGEANHLLGTDITDRGWFHMYLGLVLSLLAYFPQNDIRPNENASARSSYDTLMASIDTWVAQYTVLGYDDFAFLKKDLLRSLWTLWTNSATVAAIAAAEERADSDMGDVTLVHPLFCQSLKEQAGAPRIALMFNKPVERGAIDDVLEEAVKAWHHPRPDNVFTQSLSGWSTLMQGIQQALEKTSAKFETFHEEEASGKISTRKWRQLAAMKDALPRLWGMMAACLALVEWLVIYQLDEDGASVEHASIQTHPILVIPPVRGGKGSEINGTVGAGGAEQQPQQQQQQQSMRSAEWAARVSKQEVQLRVKLMAFVDRFVISIERFSLEAVEQAWGSLRTQLAKILVEQYLAE